MQLVIYNSAITIRFCYLCQYLLIIIHFLFILPVTPVMVARNRILSIKIVSSLEPALFQLWLMDGTFHNHISVEIMDGPLSRCPMSLIFFQELCVVMRSHFHHLAFSQMFHDRTFPSHGPELNFFLPESSGSKGIRANENK